LVQSPLKLQVPTLRFDSEAELAEHLYTEDSDQGISSARPQYLYRGQLQEFRRQWPLKERSYRPLSDEDLIDPDIWQFDHSELRLPIPLLPYTLDLPSLIPIDTRAYEEYLEGVKEDARAEEVFDDLMVYFWTSVCSFIVGLAIIKTKETAAIDWYRAQWQDLPRLYKLRSIGQHYGMETGLLDATSSVHVALWFATHDFRSGAYSIDNQSIIYRIDLEKLKEVEQWTMDLPEHEGKFDAFSVDIRDTPENVAPRAVRQQGWSLVGWEHPRLVAKMVAKGGLTQYLFPTGATPSRMNSLQHSFLAPGDDLMRQLFERFWPRQLRSIADAQEWADRYWNVAAMNRIQIDANGNWVDQITEEISRIFDYYSAS